MIGFFQALPSRETERKMGNTIQAGTTLISNASLDVTQISEYQDETLANGLI